MVVLPVLPEGSHFTFSTELDGTSFGFEFRWNNRDSGWYLFLYDGNGDPLAQNVRVVLKTSLLGQTVRAGFPAGYLYAEDSTGQDVEAALTDLGSRVQIFYISASEL